MFFCFLETFLMRTRFSGLHIIGYILIYLSACINPIIYVIMNKQYRQAYKTVLLCKPPRLLSFRGSSANGKYLPNYRLFLYIAHANAHTSHLNPMEYAHNHKNTSLNVNNFCSRTIFHTFFCINSHKAPSFCLYSIHILTLNVNINVFICWRLHLCC